jgi:endoribonuclease Dicer
VGQTTANAAKNAAVYALDAIEGDPGFITRTCDCRAKTQAKKAHKALKHMLATLQEQDDDQEAVEKALALMDGDEDGAIVEAGDSGELQV